MIVRCIPCESRTSSGTHKYESPASHEVGLLFFRGTVRHPSVAFQVQRTMASSGRIYTGVGGWTFAPWRGVFYPDGLKQAAELAYASSHLTAIEINGTFYRTQSPATFRKWAAETPEAFRFSVK